MLLPITAGNLTSACAPKQRAAAMREMISFFITVLYFGVRHAFPHQERTAPDGLLLRHKISDFPRTDQEKGREKQEMSAFLSFYPSALRPLRRISKAFVQDFKSLRAKMGGYAAAGIGLCK
jgi:hypothetical protein